MQNSQEKTELYCLGKLSEEHQAIILSLTPTSAIHFSETSSFGATALVGHLKLTLPIPESLKAKEKMRLEKEQEKLGKLALSTKQKLANPDFRLRAPQEVVQKLEQTLSSTEKQLAEVEEKLTQF